jgi:NAD(P)-dependent dehydrogenase (short-subunit alcohol dehydrogenase family)
MGVEAIGVGLDVTDVDAVSAAVPITAAVLGSIGGLVHAAGTVRPAIDDVVDLDTWDLVLGVNLRAEAVLVSALLPALRSAGPGSAIVGIASIEGLIGHGFVPSYVASKHALIGLTRSFAHRLGSEGIRANAVCPGYIDTPMLAPTIATPEARASFERKIPSGRLGEPDDVARVVRFLLSEEASYMNGSVVVVDGGVTAVGGQEALGAD